MAAPLPSRAGAELDSHSSFPVFRVEGEKPRSGLERFLSLFADVRSGEAAVALLLALDIFLLLTAYYLLKPAREALILTERNAEVKAYSAALQAGLLIVLVPGYAWIGTHVNRVRLVGGAGVFFAANLIAFSLAGARGIHEAIPFYVWVGIFNVFSISQFWAFANDLYTEAQGKRLFPMVALGSSIGGVLGASITAFLVGQRGWTAYQLMLLSCMLVLGSSGLTVLVNALQRKKGGVAAKNADQPLEPGGTFSLVVHNRYLLWIAVLMILLNFVNSGGEYVLAKVVSREAASRFAGEAPAMLAKRGQFIGAFEGAYMAAANSVGLLIQFFLTSRVIRYLGVRGSLFVLPSFSLLFYSLVPFVPGLEFIRWGKAMENGTDYSLQNTVRQALYLPTSREAKYKAKAFNDTVCMRLGDVLSGGFVAAMKQAGTGLSIFVFLNASFAVAWLWVAGRIAKEHKRLTA
jgi:ATP:ADP antiporter, AAA family